MHDLQFREVRDPLDRAVIIQSKDPAELIRVLEMCDALVTTDSFFVDAAAALDKPTLAIMGPTSGRRRLKHYSNVTAISAHLPCSPCWRTSVDPCLLTISTNPEESLCLTQVTADSVVRELKKMLQAP